MVQCVLLDRILMYKHAFRLMCILTKELMTVWLISRKHFSYQEEPAV